MAFLIAIRFFLCAPPALALACAKATRLTCGAGRLTWFGGEAERATNGWPSKAAHTVGRRRLIINRAAATICCEWCWWSSYCADCVASLIVSRKFTPNSSPPRDSSSQQIPAPMGGPNWAAYLTGPDGQQQVERDTPLGRPFGVRSAHTTATAAAMSLFLLLALAGRGASRRSNNMVTERRRLWRRRFIIKPSPLRPRRPI